MPKKFAFLRPLLNIFCGVILAIWLISNLARPALATATGVSAPNFQIHFLSLYKSQNEESAKSLLSDFRLIGAGGFVWQVDTQYHIFSSGYENKNDAVLVQNNLGNDIKSEIVSLKFEGFELNISDEQKIIQKAVNSFLNTFKQLYDIAISLDTQVYNEISARLEINSVHSAVSSIRADFDTLYKSDESPILSLLSNAVYDEEKSTQKLCSGLTLSQNQPLSSLIKYRYLEILKIYDDLLKDLKNI